MRLTRGYTSLNTTALEEMGSGDDEIDKLISVLHIEFVFVSCLVDEVAIHSARVG